MVRRYAPVVGTLLCASIFLSAAAVAQEKTKAKQPETTPADPRAADRAAIGEALDAGVANLTKDATPILIHLKDGQTRQMNLVRLEQPSK